MATLDRPILRPVTVRRVEHEGRSHLMLGDPLGIATEPIIFPIDGHVHRVIRHFDGQTTWPEVQARVFRDTGRRLTTAELENLVGTLDRTMILDGPTFADYRDRYRKVRERPASHAGRSYSGTESDLRAQLSRYFNDRDGSGAPDLVRQDAARIDAPSAPTRLRGIFSPHIDFHRGGTAYTWSYKELVERSDAETFVILGVAHQGSVNRFALTHKDFETPLGLVSTDRAFVDRIAAVAGEHLFDDELSHRSEHSIEFQAVFLQYLLGGRRDFSIVPILVGSFHDLMGQGIDPIDHPEVRQFVDALRAAESASGKRVAYIGGIDFGHVGPEFGDQGRLDDTTLNGLREFDSAMLDRASASDPAGWFAEAARVGDRWRVCGLAAAYTMLHAMGPASGRLLRYDQAVNRERTCCVSFASVVFQGPEPSHADAETRNHD